MLAYTLFERPLVRSKPAVPSMIASVHKLNGPADIVLRHLPKRVA
jgi:hypothetical protein